MSNAVPEQAVEALVDAMLDRRFPKAVAVDLPVIELLRDEARSYVEALRTAFPSLVGVQREDVARAFERLFPQYKCDGFTGGDRQDYETLKAVLALPHTGQPQEGRDLNAMALLKRLRRPDSYCADGCEGRCIECPDSLIRDAAAYIEHILSAAPAPPRAEDAGVTFCYVMYKACTASCPTREECALAPTTFIPCPGCDGYECDWHPVTGHCAYPGAGKPYVADERGKP
jgi:hypothetical protein